MVCQACGSAVGADVRFCPRCGAQITSQGVPPVAGGYPVPPPLFLAPRVQQHLQTLGYLWIGYGALRLVGGLLGMVFMRAMFFRHGFNNEFWPFHSHLFEAVMPAILGITLVRGALSLFTGWSLLMRKPWGRTLGIVAAILTLIKPLLGTALGVYTLWVLAPAVSGAQYEAIADRT